MIFPHQVGRQKYRVVALEVFLSYVVDAFHLPEIVMDDVPIDRWEALGDSFQILEDDRCTVEACLLVGRRWLKAHH